MDDRARLQRLLDQDAIAAVINRLFVGTDARDWAAVRACFAPEVLFDMTSLAGGDPSRLTPPQITDGWESGLRPIEAIHHQWGNLAVEAGAAEASATCYGIAYHFRRTRPGRNTRVFVGSYDFHLRRAGQGWLIDAFRFTAKFVDGNLALESEPGA